MNRRRIVETPIMFDVRAAVAETSTWCMRNNTGFDLQRKVHYGLGLGGADLIAITSGRFIGLEVKSPTGRVKPDQQLWADAVRRSGAFAAIVRSRTDAIAALERAQRCECPHCHRTIIPRWIHDR